jgi:cytochrome P450
MSKRDFLAEFDAAAPECQYPLVQSWIQSPARLAFFAQLRAERPVLQTPVCTLVANYVDVADLLQLPQSFTVDLYKAKMGVTATDAGYLMAHDDDALHYREKSLMQGLLNRDDLPAVRQQVAKNAATLLRQAAGEIELVNQYCRLVPVLLVQQYFGLDGSDKQDLIRWSYWNQYDAFHNQPIDLLSDQDYQLIISEHAKVSEELQAYIAVLMARKVVSVRLKSWLKMLLKPPAILLSRLLGLTMPPHRDTMVERMVKSQFASSVDFPLLRVGVNAGGLLIGAIETTSQAVAQTVQFFLQRPELLQQAKALARQDDVAGFDAMVWEALRFVPISPDIFRKTAADCDIGLGTNYQTRLKKGTIVRLLTQSAMFDPFAYQQPETFNPQRDVNHNFVFGYGPHQCLGKYVGMQLIPEMVKQVLLLDNIQSKADISYVNAVYFPDRPGPFPEHYQLCWQPT